MITNRIFVLFLICSTPISANNREVDYQSIAAKKLGGDVEVTMPDGTRCDIVTSTHAIEMDFDRKWAESIGQSLNYAFQSNKRAGIILILEDSSDTKALLRVNSIISHYKLDITLWLMDSKTREIKLYSEKKTSFSNHRTFTGKIHPKT